MQQQDIEYYLSLLGQQLEELGLRKPIRLLMIGGGFMLTQVGNRPTTNDIDVFVKDIPDPVHSEEYRIFKNAVRFVSYDAHIPEAWLSDTITDFLTIAGPVPEGKQWRKFGRYLVIYIPSKDFILAHKLIAGRRKDFQDIDALIKDLGVSDRKKAQKILEKYITNKDILNTTEIKETLDIFFK